MWGAYSLMDGQVSEIWELPPWQNLWPSGQEEGKVCEDQTLGVFRKYHWGAHFQKFKSNYMFTFLRRKQSSDTFTSDTGLGPAT